MVGPNALDGNRARLAVCDDEALQCRHLGARVGWVRNRAEGDLHALRPQVDADITAPAAIEKMHVRVVGETRREPIVRRPSRGDRAAENSEATIGACGRAP